MQKVSSSLISYNPICKEVVKYHKYLPFHRLHSSKKINKESNITFPCVNANSLLPHQVGGAKVPVHECGKHIKESAYVIPASSHYTSLNKPMQ